jgi:hypothetical protein
MSILLALALAATQAPAPPPPATGRETIITQAGGGALREWKRGEVPGVLYVRDRTEHWYRVRLTGPCRMDRPLDTLTYTTDPNGNFDRFSRIRLLRYPDTSCGVASIMTSAPPPGRQGVKKPR